MSTSAVEGYDPAESEKGSTPNQGKIRQTYEKLLERGEEEKAEELRRTSPVSKQTQAASEARDFCPVCDQAYTTSRVRVVEAYEALQDADRTDDAEELRYMNNLNSQKRRAGQVRKELGEEQYGRDGI